MDWMIIGSVIRYGTSAPTLAGAAPSRSSTER